MPRRSNPTSTALRAVLTLLIAAAVIPGSGTALAATPAPATGTPMSFSTPSTPDDLDATVAGTARFRFALSKADKRALASHRQAEKTRTRAEQQRKHQELVASRLARIQALIDAAREQQGTLRVRLQDRLVERYKEGEAEATDMAFLLASSSATDAFTRAKLIGKQDETDQQLIQEYDLTSTRLEELETALEVVSDESGQRAIALDEQADELDVPLYETQEQRLLASANRKVKKGAGFDGTWALQSANTGFGLLASSFQTTPGGSWNGGTRTAGRPATPGQIAQILNDPRVDVYAGGRIDIGSGRVDGRLLDALMAMANQFGSVRITSLISGHGTFTSSGNISMHTLGCAADIGSVAGQIIQSSTQGPGSITEMGVKYLAGLPADLSPHQVISLYSFGGPTLAMGDHHDHIHLGYSC